MVTKASLVGLIACVLAGCGGSEPAAKAPDPTTTGGAAASSTTGGGAVTSFAKAADSLKVDKVGGSDGALAPDGNMDAAFTAEVEGPLAALVVVSVDAQGNPTSDFQTDTLVGDQKLPAELASSVKAGKNSAGMGVYEGGKALNAADGSVSIPAGKHSLTLYFANTGTIASGGSIRLYGVRADQSVVKSAPAAF